MPKLEIEKISLVLLAQYYAFERLERLLHPEHIRPLLQALRELKDQGLKERELGLKLTQMMKELRMIEREHEIEHFERDWFGEWFPKQPVASIVLEGAITACSKATEGKGTALPVTAYWSLSPDAKVRVAVCRSPHQVTILFFTPRPATGVPTDRAKKRQEPIWLVEAKSMRKVETSQVEVSPIRALQPGAAKGRRASKVAPKKRKR